MDHFSKMTNNVDRNNEKMRNLQQQFKDARASYLKEVAMLRDHVRTRGDPMIGQSMDVTFFFEPTETLSAAEKDFMLECLREKLKMIVEANPTCARTYDFGQIEKLASQVEKQQVTQLKEALKKKCDENLELEHYI